MSSEQNNKVKTKIEIKMKIKQINIKLINILNG